MTCIVGLIDKRADSDARVYIGADSAAISDNYIEVRRDSKVFQNGEFVIGCTSSFRMIQLLQYSFIPPEMGDKDIFEYMCTDFINAVRDCFSAGGYLSKDEYGVEGGGKFLVGYKDRLFIIDSDFQVGEVMRNFMAIGSGEDYALGSLYSTSYIPSSPEARIINALEAAAHFCPSVRAPFKILNT